ncbi:MAG: type I secretion system permease/ATPase [Pseudomonadota bacterium]
MRSVASNDTQPDRAATLLRPYLLVAAAFSLCVNLLFLVLPLYMLQVYDRVLTSGSVETLILLTAIAVFLHFIYVAADGGRRRVLARGGQKLAESYDGTILSTSLIRDNTPNAPVDKVQHLARIQSMLHQGVLAPVLDLPFTPMFIIVLFIIHPALGTLGLVGALALVALAWINDRLSRPDTERAAAEERQAGMLLQHLVRQRAAVLSMGMLEGAVARWQKHRRQSIDTSLSAGIPSTYLSASSRALRLTLQVAVLGAAAYLALGGSVSAGTIVAASIIMGRAIAPIEQTVSIWRQLILARKSWAELADFLNGQQAAGEESMDGSYTPMPRPKAALSLEDLVVAVPGTNKPLLPSISVDLHEGEIIALLGASGSGKTSLLQTLAGAWEPAEGYVRLGRRDLSTWSPSDSGRFIGYLPQHVELLTGTVFENVARFNDVPEDQVFSAAQSVGCHDMILALPKGYDTPIGQDGVHLSAGQRQSIGLARAFFGDPAMLLLDEPTAHLDTALAASLMNRFAALARLPRAERGVTTIIATHDVRLINSADRVMLVQNRKVALTPREKYLQRVSEVRRAQSEQQPEKAPKITATVKKQSTPEEGAGQ